MIIVLDVSAAVEIILKKEKKERFNGYFKEAKWVIAPDLFVSEISNVFWKYYKAKQLSHEDCIQYVEDGLAMVDDFIEGKTLWKEALGESIKNMHSVYDMFYAVVTRRNDAKLLTNDNALYELCKKTGIDVIM